MDNCNELNSSDSNHSNINKELLQSIDSETSHLHKDDKSLKLNLDSVKNVNEEYSLIKHSNKNITGPKEYLQTDNVHSKSTDENNDVTEITEDKCLQMLQNDTDSTKTQVNHNSVNSERCLNLDNVQFNVDGMRESQENDLTISPSVENISSLPNLNTPEGSGSTSCSFNEIPQYSLYQNLCINPIPNEFDLIEGNNLGSATSLLNENSSADLAFPYTDNSIVISNSNALPQSENVVSSNYSLTQLRAYGSDESLNEEPSTEILQYRKVNELDDSDKDSDSDSSSTSSSTSILITDSSETESENDYENCPPKTPKPIKAKGELSIDDLPPIEDLKISVPEEECTPIGKVFQIVDQLVVVQALKDIPAYDLDTVLFMQGGQPLGKIFDVFGPVTEPYYCIRFNSRDHIREKNISLEQMVYSAPKTKYTNYVFLAQLMKLKGSDASWENDDEPPEIYLEYSDDEQERMAKKKTKNRKAVFKVSTDPDEPARKRHFAFERKMNARNLQVSAVRNQPNTNQQRAPGRDSNVLWEPAMPPPCTSTYNTSNLPPHQNNCHEMFGRPPLFNTRAPSPNVYFSQSGVPNRPMFNTPDAIYRPSNQMQPPRPPSNFYNPNIPFEPHCRLGSPIRNVSPGPHNSRPHPISSPPTQMPRFCNAAQSLGPNSIPTSHSSWSSSPPPHHRNGPIVRNSGPHNMFWPQTPPPPIRPHSALPNNSYQLPRPYQPPRPQPQPFWPTQCPPRPNPLSTHSSQVQFNMRIPTPPPNRFNY